MKTIYLLYNNQYFNTYLYWIVSLYSTPEIYKKKFQKIIQIFKKSVLLILELLYFFCYNSKHFT